MNDMTQHLIEGDPIAREQLNDPVDRRRRVRLRQLGDERDERVGELGSVAVELLDPHASSGTGSGGGGPT